MGTPVIVCGRTVQIGTAVLAGLKPEYDVIHFVQSAEMGVTDIPAILSGAQPGATELGSKDYSTPPIAVILGAAFDDAGADKMMKAAEGLRPVPWLRPDTTKPTPPIGPEYGKAIVLRIKEKLAELEKDGKLGETKVHWY